MGLFFVVPVGSINSLSDENIACPGFLPFGDRKPRSAVVQPCSAGFKGVFYRSVRCKIKCETKKKHPS